LEMPHGFLWGVSLALDILSQWQCCFTALRRVAACKPGILPPPTRYLARVRFSFQKCSQTPSGPSCVCRTTSGTPLPQASALCDIAGWEQQVLRSIAKTIDRHHWGSKLAAARAG
jgi:hypothetical protein